MSVNVATVDEESLSNGIKNLVRWGGAVAEMFPRMGGGAGCRQLPEVIVFCMLPLSYGFRLAQVYIDDSWINNQHAT